MTKLELKENAELSAAVPVANLPPDYIDTWITDPHDRSLLEVFHRACISEGGSADEVILRGLKAVLAATTPARAAGEVGPSDDDLALVYHDCCGGCDLMDQVGFEDAARAVLARWGRPAPAPAEGEVAELVAWLRSRAATPPAPAAGEVGELVELMRYDAGCYTRTDSRAGMFTRAAALLEQISTHALVPVAVSKRLPEAEDCDAEGCIWLWDTERRWVRQCREAASSNTWVGASWLPGHALPLPTTTPTTTTTGDQP